MGQTFDLAVKLTAIDLMAGGLRRAREGILSLGKAGKQVQADFDQMVGHLEKGAKGLAVSQYLVDKIKPGVAAAADLQESLIDVKMNLMEGGKSAAKLGEELRTVKATAVTLQKEFPFGAVDVVGIQNALLKAGLTLEDVSGKAGAAWATTALATLEKLDPGQVSDALVGIATPFGLKGSQYGDLANRLQKTSAATTADVPGLLMSMRYVAGSAAGLGVNVQDTLTALGVLSQRGLKGEMGGNALDEFLKRLNAVEPRARKVMAKLGLDFFDNKGKMRALPEVIDQLRSKLNKLNDEQKGQALQMLFGDVGGRGARALIQQGEGDWASVEAAQKRQADLADKMRVRLGGINAAFTSLAGSAKTTAALFFEPWLAGLTAVGNKANDVVSKLGEFSQSHPTATKTAAGLLAGGVAAGGVYSAWQLLRGAKAGGRVLKGLTGLGSTAVGVAEGKAVEAATGVVPVFVTNWPTGFGAAEAAGGAAAASLAAKARPWLLGGAAGAGTLGAVSAASFVLAGGARHFEGRRVNALPTWERERGRQVLGLGPAASHESRPINVWVDIAEDRRSFVTTDDRNAKTVVNLKRGHLK